MEWYLQCWVELSAVERQSNENGKHQREAWNVLNLTMSLVQIGFSFWAEIQFFMGSVNHSASAGDFDFLLSPLQKARNWNFSSIFSIHQAISWIQLWAASSVFRVQAVKDWCAEQFWNILYKPGEWLLEKPATSLFYNLILLKLSHLHLQGRTCSIAAFQWNCLSQLPQFSKTTIDQSCIIFFMLLI